MTVEFCVDLPERIDIPSSLELFRRSGDDLIDRWDGARLVRAVYIGNRTWIPFTATAVNGSFSVRVADPAHIPVVRQTAATTFTPAPPAYADLLQRDPVLARLDARFPGVRQIRQLDIFTALVRCISAQQVNLRWAVTTRRRLAEAYGRKYRIAGEEVYALDPERIAHVDPSEIRALQFTTNKAVSIVATARAIVDDADLTTDRLDQLEDEAIIQRLIKIRGIGRWSAEWVLARTLGRPCVVAGDLGVRKAVGLAYVGTPLPAEAEVRRATAHWGESAGAAQALLLHALGEGVVTARPG